ncbi:unnamed protein product [Ostreobium quekettii]|uniref:Uncharacterized protein n=1 Tax=Ostreobium quekettii TaxID=121088 RepID=A0A8S1IP10_9CHLO|nr:unnamed protein product [Ostreobium quekettii]|eukprot:evm.model.scf_108.14 EVM.evm.TU.scf_108.14   scf_108:93749-96176(+)
MAQRGMQRAGPFPSSPGSYANRVGRSPGARTGHRPAPPRSSAMGPSPGDPGGDGPPGPLEPELAEGRQWSTTLWTEITSLRLMVKEPLEGEASEEVLSAMRIVVSSMLGRLPSPEFQVTLRASRDHMAAVFMSALHTGYSLRNAEFVARLQKGWGRGEVAPGLVREDREGLSPAAAAYVESLEARLQDLPPPRRDGSQLLAYDRESCKDGAHRFQPTNNCVSEAFRTVVSKLIVMLKLSQHHALYGPPGSDIECPLLDLVGPITIQREELTNILMWCLLVGHHAKCVEYRMSLERCMLKGSGEGEAASGQGPAPGRAWIDRLGSFFQNGT